LHALLRRRCHFDAAAALIHDYFDALQQTRFTDMSDGLVERIDELGARIDELEHSITR
jgi:Heat shock factor binding protein 1